MLVHAGALWQRVVESVASEFPEVSVDYLHVDAATIYMVQKPEHFDVIVTDNLFGDILTDLAGAIGGGIGLAASGNINPNDAFPSRCSSRFTVPRPILQANNSLTQRPRFCLRA